MKSNTCALRVKRGFTAVVFALTFTFAAASTPNTKYPVPDRTSTLTLFAVGFLLVAAYGSWHRARIR